MAAYPIRLHSMTKGMNQDGLRRLKLLTEIGRKHSGITMGSMCSKTECEDLRWMWRNMLVEIIGTSPLRYKITDFGKSTVKRGPEELDKAYAKEELRLEGAAA